MKLIFLKALQKKASLLCLLGFFVLMGEFSAVSTVQSQLTTYGVPAEIVAGNTTVCTFENKKIGILKIKKTQTGVPEDFFFRIKPTPKVLKVSARQSAGGADKYQGESEAILDAGKYDLFEALPTDNWVMRSFTCKILPACGDAVCDSGEGETCTSCAKDCGICPTPPPAGPTPPPTGPPPSVPSQKSTPTGSRMPGKNGLIDVEIKLGRTTECEVENELIALKIINDAIGGDGTESFDYKIRQFSYWYPIIGINYINVVPGTLVRKDSVRGNEYLGSDGLYLNPAITSYIVTQESPEGWSLNSVDCRLQDGSPIGIRTGFSYGFMGLTIQPQRVTTCKFVNTKKGELVIKNDSSKAQEGDEFIYGMDFQKSNTSSAYNPSKYLDPDILQINPSMTTSVVNANEENNQFVVVADSGSGNRIMTSPDGIDWKIRKSPKDEDGNDVDNDWQSVTYGKGLFVAVADSGDGDRVMTSPNGIDWQIRESPKDEDDEFVNNDWKDIVYERFADDGRGLFVAVADSGDENRVMTSPDGIKWTIRATPKGKDDNGDSIDIDWQSVTYGKGIFVAVGDTGVKKRIMTSSDGIAWNAWNLVESPKDEDGNDVDNDWQAVTYGKGLFVAVASSGTGNRVMTSKDGITWTIRESATDNDWKSVVYGKGLFVAVAESGSGDRVMTSEDGIEWTSRSASADNDWQKVTYAKNKFVAVASSGSGDRIMKSLDGITWTSSNSPQDENGDDIDNDWQGIARKQLNLYPGQYRVEQTSPKAPTTGEGWVLKSSKCFLENGDRTGSQSGNLLNNVEIFAGKTTTCAYENKLRPIQPSGGSGRKGSEEEKKQYEF